MIPLCFGAGFPFQVPPLNLSASKIQRPAENAVAVVPHHPKNDPLNAENPNGIIWLIRIEIPPTYPIKTPLNGVYQIPPVFLFSDLWAKVEEAISPKVVSCYLLFMRAGCAIFAKSAERKMCGIVPSLPHPGHLWDLDRQSEVSRCTIEECFDSNRSARREMRMKMSCSRQLTEPRQLTGPGQLTEQGLHVEFAQARMCCSIPATTQRAIEPRDCGGAQIVLPPQRSVVCLHQPGMPKR
jgi:hypothetical protein